MSEAWLLKKQTAGRDERRIESHRSPYAVGRVALSPNESYHKENEERDFLGLGEYCDCISHVCNGMWLQLFLAKVVRHSASFSFSRMGNQPRVIVE